MDVPFFKPDITQAEVDAVSEALLSGWITTGPRVKQFERDLSAYTGAQRVVCLNSCTAALELALRLLGVGPGDEVITTPYTYTATASVIVHVGATPVFVDLAKDSLQMDYEQMAEAFTPRTKAVIPVDIGGIMCDYGTIEAVVDSRRGLFRAANEEQEAFGRVVILGDGAHSLGATFHGRPSGSVADFKAFSFHAVKNLTTAEGGALAWNLPESLNSDEMYRKAQLLSLHGQSKDALAKNQLGSWEYDIEDTAYKWNMTDIQAAIGIAQLQRYPGMLARRREILRAYRHGIDIETARLAAVRTDEGSPSCHLAIARVPEFSEQRRNELIVRMAEKGVVCNVHYKPLPLMTAYRKLGYSILDFPNAYDYYRNEITLPLYSTLDDTQVQFIIESFNSSVEELRG